MTEPTPPLLNCLLLMQSGEKIDKRSGICQNVINHFFENPTITDFYEWDEIGGLIRKLMIKWPKHSHDYAYFIPSTRKGSNARNHFHYLEGLKTPRYWEGKQGKLRREALDFLIAKAKELGV